MQPRVLQGVFLVVFLLAFAQGAWAQEPLQVHFVVVSSSDDVSEADFQGLKELFLEHAGGYTEMPSTLGSSKHGGKVSAEEVNTSFLVAGKSNIAPLIKKYIENNKHLDKPFILVWEATRQ